MMGYMNTVKSNNDRLRELVEASGLTQVAALAVFNRRLGPAGYSLSAWKSFFVKADSTRFRALKDELLEHAEQEFVNIVKKT